MLVLHSRRSFSRFVRPVFKNIRNPYELILDTKPLMRQMKENNSRMGNLEQISSPMSILKSFRLSSSLLSQLPTRQVKFHCFDTANHQYQARETIFGQVHIDVEPVEIPVSGIPDVKKHFSIQRGVLNIKQVQLKDNQIMLLNLPLTATAETIRSHLKNTANKPLSININYCLLGFPAQAVITFVDKFEAEKIRDEFRARPMEDRGRKSVIKGYESNARELICNRRLAINGIPQGQKGMKLLAQLSKYGRVVHLDFPHMVRRNAPKQQVYSLYKNSEQMIKIIQHFSQGQSQTQYYPPAESVTLNSSRLQQFGKQMLGKLSLHNEQYYRRLQYAQEINLYPDSPLKVLHENKGYCLVLFSCSEEAQNCYFQLQNDYDIELVSDYEFNYDKKFKQFILRYIDNQAIQDEVMAAKNKFDHSYRDEFYVTNMIKDIYVRLLEKQDLMQDQLRYDLDQMFLDIDSELGQSEPEEESKKKKKPEFQEEDDGQENEERGQLNAEGQLIDEVQKVQELQLEEDGMADLSKMARSNQKMKRKLFSEQGVEYVNSLKGEELRQLDPTSYKLQTTLLDQKLLKIQKRSRDYRAGIAVQMMRQNDKDSKVGRSFSELAQLELFGKMIKRDPVRSGPQKKASDINFDYNPHHQAMIKMTQELEQYDPQKISEVHRFRDADFKQMTKELAYEEYDKMVQEYNATQPEQVPEDGNEPPRAQFSTVRHQATYRKLSAKERRQQMIAYHGMIKRLVNEYFGRFPADKINTKRKTYQLPTINRKELKFSFGDDFLTDDHLSHILNFHYDQEVALSVFTNYCKAEQTFKSLPIGQRQSIMQVHKANQEISRLLLADVGIVDEIFEAPENARQVVKNMNLHQAQQGQKYSLVDKSGAKYIVKVVKNQPLIPLDTLSRLKKAVKPNKDQQQTKLEGLVKKTMQEKGYSMAEALSAHGVSSEQIQRIAQMLVKSARIPMKLAKVLMNAKSEHHKLLKQDAANQLALQKLRMEKLPLDPDNLIKDTSLNDVLLNREANEFGTSSYKQL